jgi:hypothetical protein
MSDPVLEGFLRQQFAQGHELAAQSDLFELVPLGLDRYIATFHCKGLVCSAAGEIVEASEFQAGIWFPSDYCRHVDPLVVLTWLHPLNIWHPNIRAPWICIGKIPPATELCDLIYQCFEIITYHNWAPHDGLNPEACQWARNHQDRFPVDRRPLKRRVLNLNVKTEEETLWLV